LPERHDQEFVCVRIAGIGIVRKAKYGGMEVSEAKRLRLLEDENRKLNITTVKSGGIQNGKSASVTLIGNYSSGEFLSRHRHQRQHGDY
jgi:hypothetical protein